jgi:hydrogenase/urease accessory protein HupE
MGRLATLLAAAAAMLALSTAAAAHPMPFSTLDVRLEPSAVEVAITAHVYDLSHDLGVADPGRLLDPAIAGSRAADLVRLLGGRFQVADGDGRPRDGSWSPPEVVAERQSLRLRWRSPGAPGRELAVQAVLFPYDAAHQSFVNIYEGDTLQTQAVLDRQHPRLEHFRAGALAVLERFVAAGVRHILGGPDHLLFLLGLLLLGGSLRRHLLVVSAFTVGHSITLSLAALGVVSPPDRLVEPAIALSIVCVGADNLLAGAQPRRDLRPFFALGFGLVHGFGFAGVLREIGLPPRALRLSLLSFNLGVELGQVAVVAAVAFALSTLRARSERASRRVTLVGSLAVAAAGAFWFVQRVFFV